VCVEYAVQLRNVAIYPSYFVNTVLVDVSNYCQVLQGDTIGRERF